MAVNWKRFSLPIIIVLTTVIVFALLLNNLGSASASPSLNESLDSDVMADGAREAADAPTSKLDTAVELDLDADVTGPGVYIVVMDDAPLARYSGGVAGLAPTSRAATGAKIDARSAESVSYLAYLAERREAVIRDANSMIGRDLSIDFEYGATIVGFAAEMTPAEANRLAAMPGISFVQRETISYPQTDNGPVWSGASGIWQGDWNSLSFETEMNGANESTPVTTTVTGEGTFTYNYFTNELNYTIDVSNPDNVALTAMHIHNAPAGSDGGVEFNFGITATTGDLSEAGTAELSDAAEAALSNGELYVNVHSSDNPSGEIRGQIELSGSLGEGVVVGIIDTGIDPWNPSFAAVGGDGFEHTNPLGDGVYVGVCDPANAGDSLVVGYDATFPCNSKLIGVWGYSSSDASPRDTDGHGSHTASTAAGNVVFDSVIETSSISVTSTIAGVAPHANIIAYDGCADGGGCPGSALAASRDQALLDGVDVINYSIGSSGATGDPWADAESMQWLALRDAGIFVATSNGNAGNGAATTGSPADLPWLTAVGANSHNRAMRVNLELSNGDGMTATVSGQAIAGGYGPAEVILSSSVTDIDSEDARLCAPGAFAPGTFNGEIVVCERGSYGRVAKGESVLAGGAGGYVLAQPDEATGGPGAVAIDAHALPAVHIDFYEYQVLLDFLSNSTGAVDGTLSGTTLDVADANGDIMASFSSRGPNRTDGDLIVPSVTAPGRGIWAAYAQGAGGDGDYTFNAISGTSMSSPHTAGAGALLKAMRPGWTPAEMQSALMLTARNTVLDDDGMTVATPFAQGSGHIDIMSAVYSPLVMDVTTDEYLDADPLENNGFDIRDLNTASMGEDACVGSCTWVRTVTNASSETMTWTVSADTPMSVTVDTEPRMFSLAPGASQDIEVTVDVSMAPIDGEWIFATLNLDADSAMYPDGHMPIAVIPSAGNIPSSLNIVTQDAAGSVDMIDLVSVDITDLTITEYGLVIADRTEFDLPQDNNPGADFGDFTIFFDDAATTEFVAIEVPADSYSVIAEVVDTASPDLDLLLFFDTDGDDIPEQSDALSGPSCLSATGATLEACSLSMPAAGTYYAAVINWASADAAGDFVDLATAVVPMSGPDAGNMEVTGPMTVLDNAPFTLTVSYDEPAMVAVDKLYGYFGIGTDAANPGNLGYVDVELTYLGIPDISLDPSALFSFQAPETNNTIPWTLTADDGVLDWTTVTPSGEEAVQDGSFEEGYQTNPYWRGGSLVAGGNLPICSAATCFGVSLPSDGDWFIWFGGIAGQTGFIEQDVTIPTGDVANLTFNLIMGSSAPLSTTATMSVTMNGDTVAVFTEADYDTYSGGYAQAVVDVSAYADGGEHLLRFDFENGPINFNMFLDEVSIISVPADALTCNVIGDIDWLNVAPSSGTLNPGSTELMVTFDAAGLGEGIYSDTLCMNSNDPDEPVVNVPVTMRVEGNPPTMSTDVAEFTESITGQDGMTVDLELNNAGDGPLDWSLSEVNTTGSRAPDGVLVEEGFEEGSMPPSGGWSVVDGAVTEISWLNSTTAFEGSFSAAVFWPGNANPVDTWLISPEFNTGENEGRVDFQATGSAFWCVTEDNCDLDVWVVVGATAGDSDDIYLGAADDLWTGTHGDWVATSFDIPADLGTVRVGFHVTAADGDSIRIDNVTISDVASVCDSPSSIPWLSASPTSGRLDAGMTQDISLTFDSTGLLSGTYTGVVCVTGNDPANSPLAVPVSLTVVGQEAPMLAPEGGAAMAENSGVAGTTVTHMVELTNMGNLSGTFDITASGETWTTTVTTSPVSADIGETVMVSLEVEVPADANLGDSDTVTVTATSQADEAITAEIVVTTSVMEYTNYLPLTTRE